MKIFACLLAAAAAVAAAEGDSPRATLHVGLEECITAANIVRAARLNTRLCPFERDTELEEKAKKLLEDEFEKFEGSYSCDKLNQPDLESVRLCSLANGSSSSSSSSGELLVLLCVHARQQAENDVVGSVFKGDKVECFEGMVEVVSTLLTDSPDADGGPSVVADDKVGGMCMHHRLSDQLGGLQEVFQSGRRKIPQAGSRASCLRRTVVRAFIHHHQVSANACMITKEVYEALLARRAAGVDAASLTAADIGEPLDSSSRGPWGFATLQCLLLGLLAAGGALVFEL
ncbi:hypothetical protein Efla_000641 [Eimeria flavescens]